MSNSTNSITLGDWFDGGKASMDLSRLLAARLLLQAGSGFGKSWALRRLLEQSAGAVQQFIVDPEGEFATLREKHDYVIAAVNGGDALAHPRTAGLLLRRLMETGVSAILDISELKKPERRRFVRLFVEEMMGLPRAMWSPALVVVDEAHEFAPEKDEAESLSAIVDLATRGRKRGFALVAATQRIGKLSKDVAAELHNKLIGFTSLDIDVKRAAFELGLTPKDANETLRALKPGDFYAFGPATSQTVQRLRIGTVATTHPEPGTKKFRAPPSPTAAIKAILPKLADLPKEAEEEAHTIEDLKRALATTRRELTQAQRQQPKSEAKPQVDLAAARHDAATIKRLHGAIEALMKFVINVNATGFSEAVDVDPEAIKKVIESAVSQAMKLADAKLADRAKALQRLQSDGGRLIASVQKLLADQDVQVSVDVKHNEPFTVAPAKDSGRVKTPIKTREKSNGTDESGLPPPQQKILDKLAWLEAKGITPAPKETLAAVCDVSPTSGGYFNNLGKLRSGGLIEYPQGGTVAFTNAGRSAANPPEDDGREVHEHWLNVVSEPQRKILAALIEAHPDQVGKDDLAERINVSPTSGGYFNNLGRLRTLRAVDYPSPGKVALTRYVMP